MKKLFLFALAIICSVMSFAQGAEDWRVHPNDARYYIKGVYDASIGSTTTYTLTNVETSGITINNPKVTYIGNYQASDDDVMFTFDDVDTDCPTKYDYISYWVYDEEINEWQADVEIRSADKGMEHKRIMTIMLVLDCSSSLENEFVHDFRYVKEGALTFLRTMYNASKSGNIRIGIIGFNSLKRTHTQIRQIEPLTEASFGDMCRFINYFDVANGTALYYSLDKAMDMTSDYIRGLNKTDDYVTPIIITFTDGIDQTSYDNKKGIKNAEAYYTVAHSRIQGIDIEHYVIPFLGSDIKTEAQKEKFTRVLKSLCKPSDNYHYLPVTSMSQLGTIFGNIANSLIDRWQILRCYVAPARQGRVCWTFGKKENKPAPAPQPVVRNGRNIFVGINGTIGLPMSIGTAYYSEYSGGSWRNYSMDAFGFGMNIKLGVDFAYPIGAYFNIGGGFGMVPIQNDLITDGAFDFKAGVLMLAGDVNDRPFIIGLSPCIGFGFNPLSRYVPFEVRFGRVIKKHLYITGNLNMGIPIEGGFVLEPGIAIGYHFGDLIKTK